MKRRELLAAAAASTWAGGTSAQSGEATRLVIDWPELRLLDGTSLSPASWRGLAAVIVFWATYCPFCKRHNAHVDRLERSTRGQGLRVLGVALDKDADAVRRYMASNGYGFPVTIDGGSLRQRFTARRVIPMTCVVDAQSRLVQAIPGEMFEEDVMGLARVLQRPAS